jgi:hypothetical protein
LEHSATIGRLWESQRDIQWQNDYFPCWVNCHQWI